jgi:sec-independent protein translocase protein TatA
MVGDLLQPTHLIVLLVVVLLVFGPKRLPELGRSLGSGLRELKHSLSGQEDEAVDPTPAPSPPKSRID